MDDEQLIAWTAEHHILFADTVDSLGEEHAHDPTLCSDWDVQTLTGHMLQPIRVPSWRFLLTAAKHRSMARACDVIAERLSDRPLSEVTAKLRAMAGQHSKPWYIGHAGPFADSCIHLRDLAQPQGLDVTVPVERWVAVLDILVSPRGQESFIPHKGLADRLRWEAVDADWSSGDGPAARGSAEAIAMVLSGRGAYLDHLIGPGVPSLRALLHDGPPT